jgi:hypothetical protein
VLHPSLVVFARDHTGAMIERLVAAWRIAARTAAAYECVVILAHTARGERASLCDDIRTLEELFDWH